MVPDLFSSVRWNVTGSMTLTLKMLDDAAETVSVGSNEHILSCLDFRDDDFIPERQRAGDGVLQRLTGGEFSKLQILVTP